MKTLASSFLAGAFICIAALVFLSVQPSIALGSFLFGFGLLAIVTRRYALFTGVSGYVIDQNGAAATFKYMLFMLAVWLGNMLGCIAVGSVAGSMHAVAAESLINAKCQANEMALFARAMMCGALMHLAVDTYKHSNADIANKLALLFLCVAAFILSGFEHCIANMAYACISGTLLNAAVMKMLLASTVGNIAGGVIFNACDSAASR